MVRQLRILLDKVETIIERKGTGVVFDEILCNDLQFVSKIQKAEEMEKRTRAAESGGLRASRRPHGGIFRTSMGKHPSPAAC